MSLLIRIERYRKAVAMAESAFGRAAVNDPRLIHDMRNGRTIGPHVQRRIERLLSSRPDDQA